MQIRSRLVPILLLVGGVWVFSWLLPVAQGRPFRNQQGKTIEAELIEVTGDKAVLKVNRKNFNVPIASLSKADQAYIKEWAQKNSSQTTEASIGKGAKSLIKPNWDGPWPKTVSADTSQEIEVIKEDKQAGEYIYASTHYEFISNVRLNTSLVKRFSLLFEATNQFCRELPLGMTKPFREQRNRIRLFETRNQYFEKGGPEGSSGVYISRGGEGDILVPLTSLGVEKVGSSYSVDHKKENSTLSHEITHQITDNEYYAKGSRGWFTEGLAEYIAQSGYRSGNFDVNDLKKLKAYVTDYGEDGRGGRHLGEKIHCRDLKQFFEQDYASFLENGNFNYGMAPLIIYYFFHMDGNKDAARIKGFLKALKEKKTASEAYARLLDGRTFDQLEADITQAWRSRGIRIDFD